MKKITILLALLLSILYFRTFIWLANTWFTDPVYSHGIIIPIVSLFLAWKNIRDKGIRDADPFKPGIILNIRHFPLHHRIHHDLSILISNFFHIRALRLDPLSAWKRDDAIAAIPGAVPDIRNPDPIGTRHRIQPPIDLSPLFCADS